MLIAAALLLAPVAPTAPHPQGLKAVAVDDTADFLAAANWHGRPDIWTLNDGVIVGTTKGDLKNNTFFVSKAEYGDFELSYTITLRDGVGNSGVQVRSKLLDAEKFIVGGPQADAAPNFWGALYGEAAGGYLLKPSKTLGMKGEPVKYKLTVTGNHITIAVNGEVVQDVDFPEAKGKNLAAPARGVIAFQAHVGKPMRVEFKDIVFKNLGK